MTCCCHSHRSNIKKQQSLGRWVVLHFKKDPIFLGFSHTMLLHSRQNWKKDLNANLKHHCVCDWKCTSERCKILEKLGASSVLSLMTMLAILLLSRNVWFHNVYPVIPYCQPKNQYSQQPTCLQLFYLLRSFQEAAIYCQYRSHWLIDRWKKKKKI